MSTTDLLTAARDRIADPANHTTGVFIEPDGPRERTCSIGALMIEGGYEANSGSARVALLHRGYTLCEAARALCRAMNALDNDGHPDISKAFIYNDTRSHPNIIAAFNQAIRNETAREQEFHVTPAAQTPTPQVNPWTAPC